MDKYLKTLELDKILQMLADLTSNDETRRMALEIRPYYDPDKIREENLIAKEAYDLSVRFGTPPFMNFRNICGSVTRARSGALISLRELLDIAGMLRQVKELSVWFAKCENTDTILGYYFSSLIPNDYLLKKLENSITPEEEISDSASPELASIRRKKYRAGIKLRESLDKMVKNTSVQKCLQESNITIRDGRYVLPVKSECRNQIRGLVHDTSSSGQTIFIEPISAVEANNEIRLLESKEQEEIERIIAGLCAECGQYAHDLCENFRLCALLNLYFSKAGLAAKLSCTMPEITDDGIIELKKARHPLLDMKKAVPVDIKLGKDYNALVITGPNTGGKTVTLKTTGLLCLMTMCGLLIPVADGSRISVFGNILADIGDSQSIEQNLSTFSSHTNKVIEIIGRADERSLILLDELGSGTDPVEGAALCVAVIKRLMASGSKIMVTTHYQEPKVFAINNPNIENASCEFDIINMRPTYRLIVGSPGKSNAFEISENLGMPEDIINDAKSMIDNANTELEDVIGKLEAERLDLERRKEEVTKLKQETEKNKEESEELLNKIRSSEKSELEKARIRANSIIESTKAESNRLLDELEKLKKEKDKAGFGEELASIKSESKKSFNKMYDISDPVSEYDSDTDYVLPRKLRKGDNVYITGLDKKGIVSGEPEGNDYVYVQIGVMRTKIDIKKIRLIENSKKPEKKTQPQKKTGKIGVSAERRGKMELDIRGCSADDGIYRLDEFIDDAVMSNISLITVIHGKGTGILRKAVHDRLRTHPSVKSFRLGVFGEGEDGVTIVELK